MSTEELMRSVLICFPGYSDQSIKVGNIILPQHLSSCKNIGIKDAIGILDQLCSDGYLEYDEGSENKVAGYHLTEKGYYLLQ